MSWWSQGREKPLGWGSGTQFEDVRARQGTSWGRPATRRAEKRIAACAGDTLRTRGTRRGMGETPPPEGVPAPTGRRKPLRDSLGTRGPILKDLGDSRRTPWTARRPPPKTTSGDPWRLWGPLRPPKAPWGTCPCPLETLGTPGDPSGGPRCSPASRTSRAPSGSSARLARVRATRFCTLSGPGEESRATAGNREGRGQGWGGGTDRSKVTVRGHASGQGKGRG